MEKSELMPIQILKKIIIELIETLRYFNRIRIHLLKSKVLLNCEYPHLSNKKPTKVSDIILIEGWALSRKGIREIRIYIDDEFLGNASDEIYRPDLNKLFPDISSSIKAGFSKMVILDNRMKKGVHKLKIIAEDNNKLTATLEGAFEFEVKAKVTPIKPNIHEAIEKPNKKVQKAAVPKETHKRALRILYLVHQFFPKHYYGTERFTLNLAKQMQKRGHYPTVLTYDYGLDLEGFKNLTDEILIRSYSYDEIPVLAIRHVTPTGIYHVFHPEIENAFHKLKLDYDLIHICHPIWLSSIARSGKKANIPILMTLTDSWLLCLRGLLDHDYLLCNGPEEGDRCITHCGYDKRIKSRYKNAKELFNIADEVVVSSKFLKTLFEINGLDRNTRIIQHSVDYANVKRLKNPNQPKLVFGFIGSLQYHKGVHILISAFKRVLHRNLRLKIYGSPSEHQLEYFKMLKSQAQDDARIEFLGSFDIKEMSKIMNNISVIVVPSNYYENYPLVLLISLAYGIPTIVSEIGGMPEIIGDEYNGFLFKMGDSEELANIIERIAENPMILKKLRKNIVSPRRTEEEAMDYENLYNKLLANL